MTTAEDRVAVAAKPSHPQAHSRVPIQGLPSLQSILLSTEQEILASRGTIAPTLVYLPRGEHAVNVCPLCGSTPIISTAGRDNYVHAPLLETVKQ